MKKIILYPYYGNTFLNDKVFKIDNGTNIFFEFDKILKKKNIEIHTFDKENGEVGKYFYCDAPYPWEIKKWIDALSHIDKNILLCFESPIINPFSQFGFMKYFFKKIYTWNDDLVDNKKFYKFYIPQLSTRKIRALNFKEKKFLVMINNNKSANFLLLFLSKYKTDLYAERRRLVNFLKKKSQIDLYGKGWGEIGNGTVFPTKEGKNKVLNEYKFCICFENTCAPGYVTEKMLDCFQAGTVPVYYGAPNIDKYVNPNSFIDYRKFKNYEDLLEYLNNLSEKEYNQILKNGEKVIEDKKLIKNFFEPEVYFLQNLS